MLSLLYRLVIVGCHPSIFPKKQFFSDEVSIFLIRLRWSSMTLRCHYPYDHMRSPLPTSLNIVKSMYCWPILVLFGRDKAQSKMNNGFLINDWIFSISSYCTLYTVKYIRKPFPIYDFAPDPFWISFYMTKSFHNLYYQCVIFSDDLGKAI